MLADASNSNGWKYKNVCCQSDMYVNCLLNYNMLPLVLPQLPEIFLQLGFTYEIRTWWTDLTKEPKLHTAPELSDTFHQNSHLCNSRPSWVNLSLPIIEDYRLVWSPLALQGVLQWDLVVFFSSPCGVDVLGWDDSLQSLPLPLAQLRLPQIHTANSLAARKGENDSSLLTVAMTGSSRTPPHDLPSNSPHLHGTS